MSNIDKSHSQRRSQQSQQTLNQSNQANQDNLNEERKKGAEARNNNGSSKGQRKMASNAQMNRKSNEFDLGGGSRS